MQKYALALALGVLLTPAISLAAKAEAGPITEEEAHAIGVEAYLYLYPLVSVDITRRQATNIEPGKKPGFGPANMFHSFAEFPTAEFKTVVRPNFDTLYSSAFLDLTKEPVIVSTSLSSSSPASAYGCAFMSARPNQAIPMRGYSILNFRVAEGSS